MIPILNDRGQGLSSLCAQVGTYLCDQLEAFLTSNGELGGYDAAWGAFQAEIAIEELFHGQPRSPGD